MLSEVRGEACDDLHLAVIADSMRTGDGTAATDTQSGSDVKGFGADAELAQKVPPAGIEATHPCGRRPGYIPLWVYSGRHDPGQPDTTPNTCRPSRARSCGSRRARRSRRTVPPAVLDHAGADRPDGRAVGDVRDDPGLQRAGLAGRAMD